MGHSAHADLCAQCAQLFRLGKSSYVAAKEETKQEEGSLGGQRKAQSINT
jgi:hypothetical protein